MEISIQDIIQFNTQFCNNFINFLIKKWKCIKNNLANLLGCNFILKYIFKYFLILHLKKWSKYPTKIVK